MTEIKQNLSEWISEQHSWPYRLRKSLVKKINPSLLEDHQFTSDFFGMKFKGNAGNYIERMVYFCGAYEKYMLYFMRDMIKVMSNDILVFWDIGANVGNHSLFMSKYVKRVHAFEPYDLVRNQFETNVELNRIKNITIHPIGLSNKSQKIPFFAPPEGRLGNGSFVEECNDGNKFLTELEVKTGDKVAKSSNILRADFIKIDVEGFERNVLEGMQKIIEKSRPIIIFELSEATRESLVSMKGLNKLIPHDYGFYRFSQASRDKGHYRLAPLDFNKKYKRKDVICIPKEKLVYLDKGKIDKE